MFAFFITGAVFTLGFMAGVLVHYLTVRKIWKDQLND